jgi:glycosyltransferase involved in cell wall biosynthesis
MNVLYVSHCDVTGHSAIHVMRTASALRNSGVDAAISFPKDPHSTTTLPDSDCRLLYHHEAERDGVLFADCRGPDLIHAWTPREHVRKLTELLVERYSCRYLVHLEDNEEAITADELGRFDFDEYSRLPVRLLDEVVEPTRLHPRRAREFLSRAAGVTALIDRLLEFKPAGLPSTVFWPGFDESFLGQGESDETRAELGIRKDEAVLVYSGNIHHSNHREVTNLIVAAGILNRRRGNVKLVKTGANHAAKDILAAAVEDGFAIDLGFVPRERLPHIIGLADVLVQPGRPGPFNDYRFPSKLPEFLATGKPVILPATNIGCELTDGLNCKLLHRGDPIEIADAVEELLDDPEGRCQMGRAGKEFAIRNLDWSINVRPIAHLYSQILSAPGHSHFATRPVPDVMPVRLVVYCQSRPSSDALEAARCHGVHDFRFNEPLSNEFHERNYLAMAMRQIGRKPVLNSAPARVKSSSNPLYPLWLAAMVQQTMALQPVQEPILIVDGWDGNASDRWLRNTWRGLTTGIGTYLRGRGLPVLDREIERALRNIRTDRLESHVQN